MKSRLQCRFLSKTIKLHVDCVGLKLKVNDYKVTEIKMWKRFIKHPEIFFEKVIIENFSNDSNSGLVLAHPGEVKNLQILGFMNSSLAWDTQFATNLTELCFQGCSLAVCSLDKDDNGEENLILLPNLKKIYLSTPGNLQELKNSGKKMERYNGISWKINYLIRNLVKNSIFLLQKIRSTCLKTMCFKFEYIDFEDANRIEILVSESLGGFIQAHKQILEILVTNELNNSYFTIPPVPTLKDDNALLPSELKYIYYRTVPITVDHNKPCYIYHLMKSVRDLEELIVTLWWTAYRVESSLSFNHFLNIVCTNNCNNLKFVRLLRRVMN